MLGARFDMAYAEFKKALGELGAQFSGRNLTSATENGHGEL